MYAGKDFSVSDGGFDVETYTFDFAPAIQSPSLAIASVVFTLQAVAGADANASTRMGSSSVSAQTVSIPLTALLPGVKYRLQAVATLANGSELSVFSFIYSQALPTQ